MEAEGSPRQNHAMERSACGEQWSGFSGWSECGNHGPGLPPVSCPGKDKGGHFRASTGGGPGNTGPTYRPIRPVPPTHRRSLSSPPPFTELEESPAARRAYAWLLVGAGVALAHIERGRGAKAASTWANAAALTS